MKARIGAGVLALLLWQTPLFQIRTTHLPLQVAGQPYRVQLQAEGGTPPYQWTALNPGLPPGLQLDAATGLISGALPSARPFSVLVEVADSATPPLQITRLLRTSAGPPITLRWSQPLTVSSAGAGGRLSGAVTVGNGLGAAASLTVIVTAVNANGKAFALRYDHETLAPKAATSALAFSVALPPGQYVVHVDAAAEVAASGAVYRNRLQQSGLTVPQQR